jgi:hypothetical protein
VGVVSEIVTVTIPEQLITLVREQSAGPVSPGVRALAEAVLTRYGDAAQAVLVYGSCLRTGDDGEGLVDLYVLVDSYRSAYRGRTRALLNKLLPPNVFYLELSVNGRVVRAKYAVLSVADFRRGASMRCFHSYFWGRFAQPVGLVYARTDRVAEEVVAALAQAAVTFIARALPQQERDFDAGELWRTGLRLSYRAELRAERPDRVARLFDAAAEHYDQVTRAATATEAFAVEVVTGTAPVRYRPRFPSRTRLANRFAWRARRVQGKALSVLRLLKAVFTFDGGVDYVLWKIERHSGVTVEVTPRLRRHPLLAAPVLSWRLYRRGAFR